MIRTRQCVSTDGYVATPTDAPRCFRCQWDSTTDYGFPDFIDRCEAVVMGRTTFGPALQHHRWPWPGKQVYVLTSSPLPNEAPDDVVVSDGGVSGLVGQIRAAKLTGDVHLVGGPRTIHAFQQIGALDRLELVVLPILLGEGLALSPKGAPRSPLRLESHREFPAGAIEHVYSYA